MRSSAGKRGGVVPCIALVVMLLCEEGQKPTVSGRLPAVSSANSAASQLLGGELLCRSTTGPAHHLPYVRCDPWQPPAPRVRGAVRVPVLGDGVPEAVHVLLPKVLRVLPLRAAGHLRQQAVLPVLQRLEDQEGRPQVPVDDYWCYSFVAYLITALISVAYLTRSAQFRTSGYWIVTALLLAGCVIVTHGPVS